MKEFFNRIMGKTNLPVQQIKALELIDCFAAYLFSSPGRLHRRIDDILNSPQQIPQFNLMARCLRAELHRGSEKFDEAALEYQLALEEGRKVEEKSRARNEWFYTYFPKALLGLFTVMRRILETDMEKFHVSLATLKSLTDLPLNDLPAQIKVAESIFFRQLGNERAAFHCIQEAIAELSHVSVRWYTFWEPEHFDAHQVLICLSSLEMIDFASPHVEALFRRLDLDHWSRAVASIAQIHLRLRSKYYHQLPVEKDLLNSEEAERLLFQCKNSKDPTWESEGHLLLAACAASEGNIQGCNNHLEALCDRDWDPNVTLLRGVEISAIALSWPDGFPDGSTSQLLKFRAQKALKFLDKSLLAYGVSDKQLKMFNCLLESRHKTYASTLNELPFFDETIISLRARLWP